MNKPSTIQAEAIDMLSLLADSESRDILEAAAAEPASVSELAERCGMPTSTAYRKVRALFEAGLLEERVRIRPGGRNPSEYLLREGEVTLTIGASGESSLDYEADIGDRVEDRADISDEASTPFQLSTDGGKDLKEDTDVRECGFDEVFVDATGVEEAVDR